jgi:hypothetical protein
MNQLRQPYLLVLATLFLLFPFSVFAEESTTVTGNEPPPQVTTVTAPKPPIGKGGQPAQRSGILRGSFGTTTGKELGGEGMKGGRMMASDTRPLPPELDKLIEKRNGEERRVTDGSTTDDTRQRGRIMGTGTPRDCISVGSTTDCMRVRESKLGEIRERMGEHRGEVFKHAGEMILKRMHAAIERFTKLADRIDSRISKLRSSGLDTSAAEASLMTARSKIALATKSVADAEAAVKLTAANLSNGTSTSPSEEEKKPAKDALEKARQAILVATKSLNDVIPLLSGKHNDNDDRATSTMATGTLKIPEVLRAKEGRMPTTTTGRPNDER